MQHFRGLSWEWNAGDCYFRHSKNGHWLYVAKNAYHVHITLHRFLRYIGAE